MAGPTKFMIKQARKQGRRRGIKPSDLLDLMEFESGFTPGAVSSANAQGLTQFIPSTAQQYGVKYGTSKKAQKTQIRGAAKYLDDLGWGKSEASIRGALAGYYGAASPYADKLLSQEKYSQYDKGNAGISAGVPSPSKKKTTSKKVMTSPGVDLSTERSAAALEFIQTEDKDFADYLSFAETQSSLADQPAQFKTKTTTKPGSTKAKETGSIPIGSKGGSIVQIGKMAQQMGLYVGEHPKFGGVDPVHATGSYHYSGDAVDVSGDVKLMRKFAKRVAKRYGKRLAELFWNGPGATNIDNGKSVAKGFVSGHTDHVHVAL